MPNSVAFPYLLNATEMEVAMPEDKTSTDDIAMGAGVLTRDGSALGSVKEITARSFKVDAPFHKDYWLPRDCITSCDNNSVVLSLAAASISEYQMDAPELDETEDPFKAISDKPLSEQELLDQRARMERELAEQSRNLPGHEPSVTELRGAQPYERIPADHASFKEHAGQFVPNAPVHDQLANKYPYDGDANDARKGSILMIVVPVALTAAAIAGAVALIRRRRHSEMRKRAEDARKQVERNATRLREQSRDYAASVAHAARPMAMSVAERGMQRTRRLLHDGLVAAAKKVE